MKTTLKLTSLEYLRGIAASLVVVFHIFVEIERYYVRFEINSIVFSDYYQIYQDILAIGVDIFFVVSGVVMVLSTRNLRRRGKALFLFRRLLRILPLYWVLTISYALLIIVASKSFSEATVDSIHLIKSLMLVPAFAPNGEPFPLLVQGWTLTYEVLFYGLFSLTLFIENRKKALLTAAALVLFWHLLIYTPLSKSILITRSAENIILEFTFGMLLGYLWINNKLPSKKAAITFFISATGILFALYISSMTSLVPRAILWGIPSTFLVAGFLMHESNSTTSSGQNQIMLFLGTTSYSIYLAHDVAISACLFVVSKLGILAVLPFWILAVILFLFSIACSAIVFYLLEKPLMRFFSSWNLH